MSIRSVRSQTFDWAFQHLVRATKTVTFMGHEYHNWPSKVVLLAYASSKDALIPPTVAWQLTCWISYALPLSLWVDHQNSFRSNALGFDLMTQHLFQSLSIDSYIACGWQLEIPRQNVKQNGWFRWRGSAALALPQLIMLFGWDDQDVSVDSFKVKPQTL